MSNREAAAYHEAGHTVVQWLSGRHCDIVHVDVRPNDQFYGHVRLRFTPFVEPLHEADPHRREIVRAEAYFQMVSCLAGPAAEARYRGEEWWEEYQWQLDYYDLDNPETEGTDMGQLYQYAFTVYGEEGQRPWGAMHRAAAWTEELLAIPRVWSLVEALAQRLQVIEFMEGEEVCDLLASAWDGRTSFPVYLLGRKWRRRFASTCPRPRSRTSGAG